VHFRCVIFIIINVKNKVIAQFLIIMMITRPQWSIVRWSNAIWNDNQMSGDQLSGDHTSGDQMSAYRRLLKCFASVCV